jgi:hypothetical protein
MTNKSKITRFLGLSLAIAGFVLMSGSFVQSNAQTRDPFFKPEWARPKTANPTSTTTSTKSQTPVKAAIVVVSAPAIEQRIAFYKIQRERAAMNGQEIPKVTSVLTLDEMSVTGIFRTPRGYAAMVEAKPIKLSYTIYPGEKFFDGQLVAIEENKLIFRKITKMSNSKFISSVENKTLREYSILEEVQGTAPIQGSGNTEVANQTQPVTTPVPTTDKPVITTPSTMVSPLDEMNKQQTETKDSADSKTDKKVKKPTKVAKNKK